MLEVNVTELRRNLPSYLRRVRAGEEILITSRGRGIAKLSPPRAVGELARGALEELRSRARIGDVVSPIDVPWAADDRP